MSPLKLCNTNIIGPEYSKIIEAQIQYLKIDFKHMTEVLKKKMIKSLKEIYENTNTVRK